MEYDILRYTTFTLPDNTIIYLTQRPDAAKGESVNDFIDSKKPDVRFCFCDDFVNVNLGRNDGTPVPFHWLPWIPDKNIPIENVFAFLSLMENYSKQGYKIIWLHCDSSTMRAPTFIGLYLLSKWPDQAKEIEKKVTGNNDNEIEMRLKYSIPTEYAEISVERDPGIKGLVESWQKGGESEAYIYYMNQHKETKNE